ncbi:methyltransferase [Actinomadura flavalba]|uniref:methyltransferase n=1 Tax=Actinomadura flavalba TaxID=1120938 RepID=UPI000362F84A|nr:methyltransferase [Actinomadura flavalba]
METPWGAVALARYPEDGRLRAWDAADEYLLRHLAEGGVDLSGSVVALGDRWGALTAALASAPGARTVTQVGDSYLGRTATVGNLERNGVEPSSVRLLTTRDAPPERVDVLLVRVPKALALLDDQLRRIAPALHAGSVVVGTGMVKEIHTSTLRLFEDILGPTRTSLAVRKARLIFTSPDKADEAAPSPWPQRYALPADVGPASGRTVVNHAGIFCADRLDIGTRFFLNHLPTGDFARVIDLGCANGVVGLSAALAHPDADILFTDESYQAVASAEETVRANGLADRARFRVGDGLDGLPPGSADLVLVNPPFHSHQATTDATAWRMFTAARDVLARHGELHVVGNRHLGHHAKLRRLFGNCTTVASNPKFVVLRAVRR